MPRDLELRIEDVREGVESRFWAEFQDWADGEGGRLIDLILSSDAMDDFNVNRGRLLMLKRVMGWPEAHLRELKQVRESEKNG